MNTIQKIKKRCKLKNMSTLRRTYRRMYVLTIPNCRVATLLKLYFFQITIPSLAIIIQTTAWTITSIRNVHE